MDFLPVSRPGKHLGTEGRRGAFGATGAGGSGSTKEVDRSKNGDMSYVYDTYMESIYKFIIIDMSYKRCYILVCEWPFLMQMLRLKGLLLFSLSKLPFWAMFQHLSLSFSDLANQGCDSPNLN